VDREAMDSLQRQGFDLNEEPEIYIWSQLYKYVCSSANMFHFN
jgi:hypothetical protein